jgi:nitroreductase
VRSLFFNFGLRPLLRALKVGGFDGRVKSMVDDQFKARFYQLLESRKSIRKYKTTPVPKELIERILGVAMHAPSGKNRQNWRFFVVQGKKRDEYLKYSQKSWLGIKDLLEKRLKPSLYAFTERFFYTLGDAPVIIFCYSLNDAEERYHTSIGSVYMAVENLVLAATAEGLGTCTMGAPLEIKSEVDEFLGIPQIPVPLESELELLCAVVLGYPDHEPPKAARQLDGRITWIY